MRVLLPLLSLLVACPDPNAAPPSSTDPAAAPDAAGGGGGGGAGGPMHMPKPVEPGTGVVLKGTATYSGAKTGKLRVDALKKVDGGGGFPVLLGTMTQDTVGAFSIEVPKDAGEVFLVAFVDVDGNGPDGTDPAGRTTTAASVSSTPVEGLDVVLSDTPDLGDLAPAGPPPGSSGAPAPLPPDKREELPPPPDPTKPVDPPGKEGAGAPALAGAVPGATPVDAKAVPAPGAAPAPDAKAAPAAKPPADAKAGAKGGAKDKAK